MSGAEHMNGDCWSSQCVHCQSEQAVREAWIVDATYGMCTACGALEVALMRATGTRDYSDIGESAEYPTGYGCEMCS